MTINGDFVGGSNFRSNDKDPIFALMGDNKAVGVQGVDSGSQSPGIGAVRPGPAGNLNFQSTIPSDWNVQIFQPSFGAQTITSPVGGDIITTSYSFSARNNRDANTFTLTRFGKKMTKNYFFGPIQSDF